MQTNELTLDTSRRSLADLTDEVAEFCRPLGDGLLHVFAPHATAGLALMELGSGSEADLGELLERLLPKDDRYRHRHGSPRARRRPCAAGAHQPLLGGARH